LVILELRVDFVFIILPRTASDGTVLLVPLVVVDLARGEVGDARYTEPTSDVARGKR
jgi:hypothetical protein